MRALVGAAALLVAVSARAAERANPFACQGESEALARGLDTAQIEGEIERRLANPPPAEEGALALARHHCVTAELMRRVGDPRAPAYYQRAIDASRDEPGFELWYGHYLRNVRGPRAPLTEQAEQHYFSGLEKLRAVRGNGDHADFDDVTESWMRRGLMSLYQEDGLPLLRAKAFPYPVDGAGRVGLALTAMVRVSRDTSEFGSIDDARRFAAEAAFASSRERLDMPLDQDRLRGIIRAPLRSDLFTRLRLRVPWLGAFDVSYERFRAPKSQIEAFTDPNTFTDVAVDQAGVAWRRAFDLYPAFDLLLDFGYRRVERVGVVEWHQDQREGVNLFEAHPAIARFIGPDKLVLGMNYVYMDIPPVEGGAVADRVRARAIRAFYVDYALYRPLLLPDLAAGELRRTATRGWHFYGGHAMDDEAFGARVVHRRDTYAGTSLRGLGRFDVTLQGTLLASDTTRDERFEGQGIQRALDESQAIRQLRPTVVALYRIVDDEAIPDVPRTPLAGLNLVVPVRADFAYQGPDAFDNVRAGVELWSKLVVTDLRGTTFLLTAGYEAQWFHRVKEVVHMGRLELRMGWGAL